MPAKKPALPKFTGRHLELAMRLAVPALARMIGTKRLDPSTIASGEDLLPVLDKLGRTDEDALEIHIERTPKKLKSVKACIQRKDSESAVVLLFTLIEGEVNSALQILLRIRGYSRSAIDEALRGTTLKSKFDLLLPLLGVSPPPRVRQLAIEAQSTRNAAVHYKANPSVFTDLGGKNGDHDSLSKKADEFLAKHSIDQFEKDIGGFVESCVSQCSFLQQANKLLFAAWPAPSIKSTRTSKPSLTTSRQPRHQIKLGSTN